MKVFDIEAVNLWDKVISVRSMALVKTSHVETLKRKLTLTSTKGNPYTLELYKHINDNYMYIPRALTKMHVEPLNWSKINLKHKITLREPQKQLIEGFLDYLKLSPSGGIISAGTGTGKTVMGIWLTCYFGLKTLVIVPTERIFVQWIQMFKSFTDIDDVGIIRSKTVDIDSPVTVSMLHTIYKERFDYLKEEFGVVIYDEVHTISTQHFNTVAGKFHSKINIGLSATPRRKDGMENVFFYHIGGIASSNQSVDAIPKIIAVHYYDPSTSHYGCEWNGQLNLGRYYNRLTNNNNRTSLISKMTKHAYDKNHNILVLTERLNHIDKIKKMLINRGVPKDDIGVLTATKKEIFKKVIIGTYGSAGLGLDIPSLSCLVLATPRTDVVQAVGRVTRAKDRKPVVIDIVDDASPMMVKWYKKRLRFYRRLSDEVIDV